MSNEYSGGQPFTMTDFLLPDWLEACCLKDETMALAYDTTPAFYRAAIKTGFALTHFHFGDYNFSEHKEISNHHLGFGKCVSSSPLSWAAICLTEPLNAPSLLAAAVALPLLAGVKNIMAIFVEHEPPSGDLLALELGGLESVFHISRKQLDILQSELLQQGEGAIFAFGELPETKARATGIRCFQAQMRPKLLQIDTESFNAELLHFLYGVEPETNKADSMRWDCVFTNEFNMPTNITTRLAIQPGCEGFWLHENISPDFFRSQKLIFKTLA